MIYPNLRSEMTKRRVTTRALSEALGVWRETVSKKLCGKRPLALREAQTIREQFFPDCTLDYLFGEKEV